MDKQPFLAFEGKIHNWETILADHKHKERIRVMEHIYSNKFISSFWKGDYVEANKWYDLASAQQTFNLPKVQSIMCTYYRGLLCFRLYPDGQGESWLIEGKLVLGKMEIWAKNGCKAVFENKLYLLEAGSYASDGHIVAAKESYELSAKVAHDHGLIHEVGLASEFYGHFLTSIVKLNEANQWYLNAHTCYKQWGALGKVDQIAKEHNLALPEEDSTLPFSSYKHDRSEVVSGSI